MPELPLQPIRRLIDKGTEDMRISKVSVERARNITEEMIIRTANLAARIAKENGRKTVLERDFKRAWVDYFMGKAEEEG